MFPFSRAWSYPFERGIAVMLILYIRTPYFRNWMTLMVQCDSATSFGCRLDG